MNKNFLVRLKMLYDIKKEKDRRYYYDDEDYNYNYHGYYRFMNKRVVGNLMAYEHVPLFVFAYRKMVVSGTTYGYRGFYSFDNCFLIHQNGELMPSLPRNIIKDYSNVKLSYFQRLKTSELEYARTNYDDVYGGTSILFVDSRYQLKLSNLI